MRAHCDLFMTCVMVRLWALRFQFTFGGNCVRVHDYLDVHAEQRPDAEFAICSGERITYGEARNQANRISRALIDSGAKPGDRVAILQKNSIETVLLYQGAFKAGIVPTPINYRLLPAEWLRICQDAKAKLLFCDAEFVPEVDQFRSQLKSVRFFIVSSGRPLPGWADFPDWAIAHDPLPPNVNVGEEEDALQMYTSGTTGPPKGAVLTHRAVTANISQLAKVAAFRTTDRFLLVLPICHAAGIIAMLQTISSGACLIIHRSFDPMGVVSALNEADVTVTMMVPTMIRKCLDEVASVADRSYAMLRLVIYGASPIHDNTVRQMMEVFGCDLAQRYGSTETLSLTWLSPADHRMSLEGQPELLRSAGHALPGTEICIMDGSGTILPNGKHGEIVVRGPQLMRGYWKSAETMDDAFREDWMHTGDVGFMDSDGYVYICDRMNDVIISGGENIYPREIEAVLAGHPNVDDAAVIGIPDLKWGESVKAIVALRSGASCSSEQLIEYCRGQLAGFKVPDSVDFVRQLPRNPSGKVLKRELREPYWRGHDRRI
jgi:acyl-CoA synthetase (AMP-forming)/AMP-acid ligase II